MKNKEIEELLDYYQKEIDKYEETKQYLMGKYGYDEETIDNISQHQRYKNNKLLLSYIEQLEKEYKLLKDRNEINIDRNIEAYRIVEQLESNRDKAIGILGNYKHYSTPTEEQNRENEDIVDNAYNILKGGSDE